VWTVRGQWAHNNNWVVESAVDLNVVPNLSRFLINSDLAEPDGGLSLDLFHNSVAVHVSQCPAVPDTRINLEGPSSFIINLASSEDFNDVVTLGQVHAEVELLIWFLSVIRHGVKLRDDLAVKHHDSSLDESAWNSEAPLRSTIDIREYGSVVVTDILSGSSLAKLGITDLSHAVWSYLTVSFDSGRLREFLLELAELLSA
jgi:hypothetical protein